MKAASSPIPRKRPQAGNGTLQFPATPPLDDLAALRLRVECLERRLAELKGEVVPGKKNTLSSAEGDVSADTPEGQTLPPGNRSAMQEWIYSPESIAEYRHAIRRLHFFRDGRPLEIYCEKTGGRVPRLSSTFKKRAS